MPVTHVSTSCQLTTEELEQLSKILKEEQKDLPAEFDVHEFGELLIQTSYAALFASNHLPKKQQLSFLYLLTYSFYEQF